MRCCKEDIWTKVWKTRDNATALAQCLPQNRDLGFCIITITTIVFKYQSHSSYFLEKMANTELVKTTQNIDFNTSTNGD